PHEPRARLRRRDRSGEVLARFRTFLVGRRREQRVARLEVCIEPAVREAGLLHHVGDPDAFVAVLANGARRRAQNPLAGFLLLGAGLDSCHMTYIIFARIGLCQALLGIRLRTGSKARRRPGFQPREWLRSDCAREEADSARVPVGSQGRLRGYWWGAGQIPTTCRKDPSSSSLGATGLRRTPMARELWLDVDHRLGPPSKRPS